MKAYIDDMINYFNSFTWQQTKIYKTYSLFRYDIPNFFKNIWLFRKNLWSHTWYNGDGSILPWVKTAVDDMAWRIEKYGHEVDESRLKKVSKMKRLSYLIDICVNDTFVDVAESELGIKMIYHDWEFEEVPDKTIDNPFGENGEKLYQLIDRETPEEKEHNRKILKRAHEIQKEYWEELCHIIKGPNYDDIRNSGKAFDEEYDGSDIRAWWD
jgi:hypothetical protein